MQETQEMQVQSLGWEKICGIMCKIKEDKKISFLWLLQHITTDLIFKVIGNILSLLWSPEV